MKTKLLVTLAFIFISLSAMAQGKLLYSGLYTSANYSQIFTMGNMSIGHLDPQLWNIQIYEQKLVCGNSAYPYKGNITVDGHNGRVYGDMKNDGGWFYVVFNDYSMYQELRLTLFGCVSITRTPYFKGNQLAQQGGSVGGYSGGMSNSENATSSNKCFSCSGTGKCSYYPLYSVDKYRCHGSGTCGYCYGRGIISGYGQEVTCNSCGGNGRCHYCRGTGRCSDCGGTGRK